MIEWFESLTAIERFFAYVAIPSTLVLVIQTVLLILGLAGGGGGGADEGFDFDSDGETDFELDPDPDIPHDGDFSDVPDGGLRLFTVRGFIAFFTVFGWGGLALLRAHVPVLPSVLIAAALGAGSMVVMALIFRMCLQLQSDGTMRLENAVGQSGSVYLTVPPARQGRGKVEVMVQDQMRELEAVTDDKEPLPTGCEVVVTAVSGRSTLVVCRK